MAKENQTNQTRNEVLKTSITERFATNCGLKRPFQKDDKGNILKGSDGKALKEKTPVNVNKNAENKEDRVYIIQHVLFPSDKQKEDGKQSATDEFLISAKLCKKLKDKGFDIDKTHALCKIVFKSVPTKMEVAGQVIDVILLEENTDTKTKEACPYQERRVLNGDITLIPKKKSSTTPATEDAPAEEAPKTADINVDDDDLPF